MFLTDTQGKTLASGTGGAIGFDLSSRPYIKTLQSGTETICPVAWPPSSPARRS